MGKYSVTAGQEPFNFDTPTSVSVRAPIGVTGMQGSQEESVVSPVVTVDETLLFYNAGAHNTGAPGTQIRRAAWDGEGFVFSGLDDDVVYEGVADYVPVPNWISPDGCRLYFSQYEPASAWGSTPIPPRIAVLHRAQKN